MTRPNPGRVLSRAYLAILLLVFLSGCGAPSDVATDSNASGSDAGGNNTAGNSEVGNDTADNDTAAAESATVEPSPAEEQSAVADQPAHEPNTAEAGATLSGRIVFDGPPPKRRVINMTKDPKCIELHGGKEVLDEATILSDDGGVKNVFVYIRRGAPDIEYPIPEEPVVLDQKDCMYRPRVGGVRVGQKLLVSNSDPVTHNVRAYPIRNRAFNFGQPPDTGPRERIFDEPEREVDVQCDIHPWMRAYFFVMDHPFFGVSDDDGTYAIDNVPPGDYTLAVWHETFGKQQQKITVGEGDLGDVDFTYQP